MNETRTSLLRRLTDLSDQASWGEFVTLYEPLLLSYVGRVNAGFNHQLSEHDVQDVVQTIFVALVRKLPGFELDRSRGRFRTWLYQVARNAVVDWLRARRRIQGSEGGKPVPLEELPAEPDRQWEDDHRQRLLERGMEKVKEKTAERTWACFELHLLQGKSGAEVGALLDLPANTVYVNASRVLTRIREQCALFEEGDDE